MDNRTESTATSLGIAAASLDDPASWGARATFPGDDGDHGAALLEPMSADFLGQPLSSPPHACKVTTPESVDTRHAHAKRLVEHRQGSTFFDEL